MLAEVAEPVVAYQLASRRRHEDLAAVPCSGDARRPVHVHPYVPLVGQQRLARMHAHADADRALLQRILRTHCCAKRVRRASERDEERVPLRVDLDPTMLTECLAERPPVPVQRLGIRLAEVMKQPRRALDVSEQEADGTAREFAHQQTRDRRLMNREPLITQATPDGHPPISSVVGKPSTRSLSAGGFGGMAQHDAPTKRRSAGSLRPRQGP